MRGIRFILILLLLFPLYSKENFLKFFYPEPLGKKPQKPKIDFQSLMENYEMPLELRNFRIKEEAEKEKKLVIKGLPKHILEEKSFQFFSRNSNLLDSLNVKFNLFPIIFEKSQKLRKSSFLNLQLSGEIANLSIFSGFTLGSYPSSTIGWKLEKALDSKIFYIDFLHQKAFFSSKPSDFYTFSFCTDWEIMSHLNFLFDLRFNYLYDGQNVQSGLNPKMVLIFKPSSSWIMSGEISHYDYLPLLQIKDSLFLMDSSSDALFLRPLNLTHFSVALNRILFSDYSVGIKFAYKDADELDTISSFLKKSPERQPMENQRAFHGIITISKEKSSPIQFSLSSGLLFPSFLQPVSNLFIPDSVPQTSFVITLYSFIRGKIELSKTSFEFSYNWASYPYALLSINDIYSSKIILEQEIPILRKMGGNLAIIVELRNIFNFLRPSIVERYLIIFYPQWIRGGLEIVF